MFWDGFRYQPGKFIGRRLIYEGEPREMAGCAVRPDNVGQSSSQLAKMVNTLDRKEFQFLLGNELPVEPIRLPLGAV